MNGDEKWDSDHSVGGKMQETRGDLMVELTL